MNNKRNKKGQLMKGNTVYRKNPKRNVLGKFAKTMTNTQRLAKKNKQVKKWNNSAKGKAYKKRYLLENRERLLKIGINNSYLRKYGITLKQKEEMLKNQNNQCMICQKIINISAAVDHDHETGKIRGILCFSCNSALGNFQDNINLLKNAIEYLKGGE